MAVRFVIVEGAFTGASGVSVRTFPGDATDSVLIGFSCINDSALGGPGADRKLIVRHKVAGPVYSGGYAEVLPDGEANKGFTPGCLGMDGSGQEIEATLDGTGTFRWQAVFRETYT